MGRLLCVGGSEASRLGAGRFPGAPGAASLQDFRCVMQRLDISEVIGLLGGLAEGGFANLPPELLPVLVECGVDLSVGSSTSETTETGDVAVPTTPVAPLDVSGLDPELAAVADCLRGTWGGEAQDSGGGVQHRNGGREPGRAVRNEAVRDGKSETRDKITAGVVRGGNGEAEVFAAIQAGA